MKTEALNSNHYRVTWKGFPQPLGSNSFQSAKMYILHSLSQGGCKLSEFQIFDKYGELKKIVINNDKIDPSLTTSYFKLY